MERISRDEVAVEIDSSHTGSYLNRCQVDTPPALVDLVWRLVSDRRSRIGSVVDFGCGDARFAHIGQFEEYTGFEIDKTRVPGRLPPRATVKVQSAFTARKSRAAYDICIGNPPYVRHHDLSSTWLEAAGKRLRLVEGYSVDGRSNAFIYFMWLALDAVKDDGLVALVIPYEWITRPSSERMRQYIARKGWRVDVYHLEDAGFERVLTTACITIIDKAAPADKAGLHLHDINKASNKSRHRDHITGSNQPRLSYERAATSTRALRGLSPGDQDFFVLTEALRLRFRLMPGRDVVPAITTFRHLETDQHTLTERRFRDEYVNSGLRCWLISPKSEPEDALVSYLDTVPEKVRNNYTCSHREIWWRTKVPPPAQILYASGFKKSTPKMFKNEVQAIHVGAVHGIYCQPKNSADALFAQLREMDFSKRVVPLSGGFLKIEVNQMNAVLNQLCAAR